MNKWQQSVVNLIDQAKPKEEREKWLTGYKSRHYKRLSIPWDEADELAEIGWTYAYTYFGSKLYYTQSLIMGICLSGRYPNVEIVTPSQYGKTFVVSQTGLILADRKEPVFVAGGNDKDTQMIMNASIKSLQTADEDVLRRLLEPTDKIEKMQASTSKHKIAYTHGGFCEAISLGTSFTDLKKNNGAIGRGGNFFVDEASRVPDDTYSEMGRAEFARKEAGAKPYLNVRISNPHNPGGFWDAITAEEVKPGTAIIWMDVLTALEEDNYKSREQVLTSKFFGNKSTCIRYLLCELEDYDTEAFFGNMETYSGEEPAEGKIRWFAGADSAYKGVDAIEVGLVGVDEAGTVFLSDSVTINKLNWEDGKTGKEVARKIAHIIKSIGITNTCIDKGYGVYLIEMIIPMLNGICNVMGINFADGTTKERKRAKHFSATYGANKRAEMHLDLQELMDAGKVKCSEELAEKLRPQMNAVKAMRKPNGKTQIISKDEIKAQIGRSPDQLDSILLAVHAMVREVMQDGQYYYAEDD